MKLSKLLAISCLSVLSISTANAFTADAQDRDNNISVTYSDNIKQVAEYDNQRLTLIAINNKQEPELIDNLAIIMTNVVYPQPSYNNKVHIRTSNDYTVPFKQCFLTCRVNVSFDYQQPVSYVFFSGSERSAYVLDPGDTQDFSERLQKSKTVSVEIKTKPGYDLVYKFDTSEIKYNKLRSFN